MLQALELATPEPSEEFLNGPITRFIKLLVLDIGYSDTQTNLLLVKWVHPLFLKAKSKASKQDNPNW